MPKIAILHPGIYGNPKNDALTTSFLPDVTVVRYVAGMTKEELLAAIPSGLTHVCFIYHYPGYSRLPFFADVPGASGEQPKYRYFSDATIEILRSVSAATNGLTLDILSCDLNETAYAEEVTQIETDLGINVRYSVDKTGNPSSGANWILESEEPAMSVRSTYFTDGVLAWNGVLTGDIAGNIKTGMYSNYIKWKASTKTFTVKVDFTWTALGLNATDFITLAANEIFDGYGHTINITGLTWEGLIKSSATTPATAPTIKNLGIIGGVIDSPGGAITRYSQKFFKIKNCYSTANIRNSAGGIAAGYSGSFGGECTITNCYSTGATSGIQSGGIVGYLAGGSGLCVISECYSTGPISGNYAGGIAGDSAGQSGSCTITNCYSIGPISGNFAGGIAGAFIGSNSGGKCDISGCYSAGVISPGINAGGITGYNPGANSGSYTITNCVCNGFPMTGGGSNTPPPGCSISLSSIDGQIYTGWSASIWQPGDLPVSGIDLPILKAFTVSPWGITTYTQADDDAQFLDLPPIIPTNSFPLRVNPYLAIGDIFVYTTEFVSALVTGTTLPDPGRTAWSTDPLPAGTLLRPLGRFAVVNGTNKLAIYRFENVQLINGPSSEGVLSGDTTGRWYTGWICTWSADGVAPVFP